MALHFELVTPAKLVRSENVHMVVVPGAEGEFGVLEGHAPFMSTIRDGAVQVYKTEGAAPESIEVRPWFWSKFIPAIWLRKARLYCSWV